MRFQFGNFTVETDSRQLLNSGTATHLSPKAFDLLVLLIHERPRALAKADLHRHLWPKTFVSDASLAMLVAEIRAALGESARYPRCLRTVHRHGYAFQGEVRDLAASGQVTGALIVRHSGAGYWLITAGRQIPLVRGDNVVGRDPEVGVWLDSPSVSRRHARIHVAGDRVTLEDLGSKNGTRSGNTRIRTLTTISDGDELRFGSVRATFRAWAADPTRSEPGAS